MFFDLVNEINLVPVISAYFLFCGRANQKETKYSENGVKVKLKMTFSLKLCLLEWLEKLQIYLWSGSYAKKDKEHTDYKYKHRRLSDVYISTKTLFHLKKPWDLNKHCSA